MPEAQVKHNFHAMETYTTDLLTAMKHALSTMQTL
jgi:hypothetical protein